MTKSSEITKMFKQQLLSLKDTIVNMSLITGTRWRKFNYYNNILKLEEEIWVFSKNRFSNSGRLDIYAQTRKTVKWKFQHKPKILDLPESGYNVGFITGFGETVLLLTNITSDEYFLFIQEDLWGKSQLDLEKMFSEAALNFDRKQDKHGLEQSEETTLTETVLNEDISESPEESERRYFVQEIKKMGYYAVEDSWSTKEIRDFYDSLKEDNQVFDVRVRNTGKIKTITNSEWRKIVKKGEQSLYEVLYD